MRLSLLALAALLVLPAFAGAGGGAPSVTIQNFAFSPGTITIDAGQGVAWTNADPEAHTVTADDASWDSGVVLSGATYTHVFPTPGVFAYHCAIHTIMRGRVVVRDPTLPDLLLASLTVQPRELAAGVGDPTTTTIRFQVDNGGGADAGPTVLRLSFQDPQGEHAIGDVPVPALAAGATFSGSLDWATTGDVGDFTLHALADATGAVAEGPAETNNLVSQHVSFVVGGLGTTGVAPFDDTGL